MHPPHNANTPNNTPHSTSHDTPITHPITPYHAPLSVNFQNSINLSLNISHTPSIHHYSGKWDLHVCVVCGSKSIHEPCYEENHGHLIPESNYTCNECDKRSYFLPQKIECFNSFNILERNYAMQKIFKTKIASFINNSFRNSNLVTNYQLI